MIGRRSKDHQTTDETARSGVGGSSAVGSAAAAAAQQAARTEQSERDRAPRGQAAHQGARTEGKGRPTPSRREQEAARVRPLVPEDRKAAKQADRAARREQRLTAQQGMAAGDARFLPPRDQGEQKAFVRDVVDSRWNLLEMLMPILLISLVFLLIPSGLQQIGLAIFYAFVGLAILDTVLLVLRVRRAVSRRFDRRESGLGFYAVMRATNLRSTRMPRPRVKRGQRPS